MCSILSSLKLFSKEILKRKRTKPKHLPNIAYFTLCSVKITCLSQAAGWALPGILYAFVSVVSNLRPLYASVLLVTPNYSKTPKNRHSSMNSAAPTAMLCWKWQMNRKPLSSASASWTFEMNTWWVRKRHRGLTGQQGALAITKMWAFYPGRGYIFARTQATEAGINKYKLFSGGQP